MKSFYNLPKNIKRDIEIYKSECNAPQKSLLDFWGAVYFTTLPHRMNIP